MALLYVSAQFINGTRSSENDGLEFNLALSVQQVNGKPLINLVAEDIRIMGSGIQIAVQPGSSNPQPGPYRITILEFVNGFYFIKVSADMHLHGIVNVTPFILDPTVLFLISILKSSKNGQTICSFPSSQFGG